MSLPWYQKSGVQAAIASGIFLIIATLIGLYRKDSPESKPSISLQQSRTQLPKSSQIERLNDNVYSSDGMPQRIPMRNGLRLIFATESNLPASRTPNGVYGFAHSYVLKSGDSEIMRTPEFGRLSFEVHKANDGVLYALAFVNGDQQRNFAQSSKVITRVTLYSDYWNEAQHAVLVETASCHGNSRIITLDDGKEINAVDCEPTANIKRAK
jgi:hypothetical protein